MTTLRKIRKAATIVSPSKSKKIASNLNCPLQHFTSCFFFLKTIKKEEVNFITKIFIFHPNNMLLMFAVTFHFLKKSIIVKLLNL